MRTATVGYLVAGIVMIAAALLAFLTPVYRRVSASYAQVAAGDAEAGASSSSS